MKLTETEVYFNTKPAGIPAGIPPEIPAGPTFNSAGNPPFGPGGMNLIPQECKKYWRESRRNEIHPGGNPAGINIF